MGERRLINEVPRRSVLHISFADNVGGSARGAYRLHMVLKQLDVHSRMLVAWKTMNGDVDVDLIGQHRLWLLDRACTRLTDRLSLQDVFVPSSILLPWRRWFSEADVLQLFNIHGGYFSFTALRALSRLRPIVWRLDDMWGFTGHCAFSFECGRWEHGCGSCSRDLLESDEVQHLPGQASVAKALALG